MLAGTPTPVAADLYAGFGAQSGYYTDAEAGLLLLTRRYYDPQAGRFLTRDPIGYGGGINLYSYTANDPINNLDPSGLSDDGDYVLSERETETAGMFSLRDPVFQQAGLNTAADLLRSVPGVGAVYAGATALSGCDSVTLHGETSEQRGWDGVHAALSALPLLGLFGGESTYVDISHWNTPRNIARMKAAGKIDPGVFVIIGKPSKWNWIKSGQAKLAGGKYALEDVITDIVPANSIHWPNGLEWLNGLFLGHRIYDPTK